MVASPSAVSSKQLEITSCIVILTLQELYEINLVYIQYIKVVQSIFEGG